MIWIMRLFAIELVISALAGCGWMQNPLVVVTVGSVAAIGRSPPDAIYSLITGRDCSIVRLDEGKRYCRVPDPPPEIPPFCTRSLGSVNCWASPFSLPGHPIPVADGPTMTAEQEAYRLRTWPWW